MGGDETVDNDSDSECEWETLTGEEKLRELSEDDLGAIIRLDGDGPITSDWHIPLTNFSLARQMTEDCERRSMGSWLVIAGDLFHQDGLNRFEQKQQGARFETAVKMILHELGEDDQRRIIVTPRDHLIIDTEEGPWRVCHTKTYRKSQLAYVAALADLHRMNVAAGHRHHCALGFSPSGYRIAELGGMHDRLKTDYLNRWTSDHPLHQSGYMLLRRGRVVCPALSG